jgi:murein DD-endopeptidase MepM/ murein hydrolase activator NlpD
MAKGIKREDEIDSRQADRFNPTHIQDAERRAGEDSGFSPRQNETLDNKIKNADSQLDNFTPNRNIKDAEQQEAAATMGLYTGSGRSEQKETASLKGIFKKKGPMGALIALGLGLPTVLSILLSPALLLQQLAETMTGAFNDQLAALDVRSTLLLKKKYNSTITKRVCGTKVTIGCKYRSIRTGSGLAKRLNKAGVEIVGDKSIIPGRIKPKEFIFEGKTIKAGDLLNEARTNPSLRSALRKGYDPVYAAFSDKISTKVRSKLGLKRSSSVSSSTDQDKMNEELKKTASGENDLPNKKLVPITDENGNPGYEDPDTKERYSVSDGESINSRIDEISDRTKIAEKTTKAGIKSGIKSALTMTALGAGAADTLCTAWNVLRVASFAAKIYQQKQLIRYSYEFVKIAHKQKYGDLTAEEMAFFGDKLTSINTEGKAALDSDGYRFAAYGDTFRPGDFKVSHVSDANSPEVEQMANKVAVQNETSRFVNGQLLNDNVMSKLVGALAGSGSKTVETADKVCKFTKSWKGQLIVFGAAVLGLVAGFFSGGTTIGLGAIANGAAMAAVSVAFSLMQPKIIDMVKGEVIKGDENGNENGNAIASGMGGYNAQASQGRGLGVATQEVYPTYNQTSKQIAANYAEEDRAARSPFDASSKNTFLGSIVASLLPYSTKLQTVGSASLSIPSFVSSSLSSFGSLDNAYAADSTERFSQCSDHEYKGLAADPFCNLRYAIPKEYINKDSEKVYEYMLEGDWITEDDPTPLNEYADYVKQCIERENSIGDDQTDSKEGDGDACTIGKAGENEERNNMFRLFYIDTGIEEGMEEDFVAESGDETEVPIDGALNLTIATFNIFHSDDQSADYWKGRLDKSIAVINDNDLAVVGLQEARPNQQNELMKSDKLGNTYGIFPTSTERPTFTPNPIIWNKSMFTLVEDGSKKFDIEYDNGEKFSQGVQVKLRDANGMMFYVLNTHDPANIRPGSDAVNTQSRADNANTYVERARQLSSEGLPVFLTGDFNSPYTEGPHCTVSSSGVLKDTWEIYKNIQGCTNSRPIGGKIDRIYMSNQGAVENVWIAERGIAKNGSDAHDTLMATVSFSSGGAGTLQLPLSQALWDSNKSDFLDAHGSTGTAWGEANMGTSGKGPHIASDIGASVGTPVYAMMGGTVSSTSLCGENDGIAIKSDINGKNLGIAYMHGTNKKFNKGDTVKAGDHIMDVGTIGCNVDGAHLHVGMAYEGKYICPQDTFLAITSKQSVNWESLPVKAAGGCGR